MHLITLRFLSLLLFLSYAFAEDSIESNDVIDFCIVEEECEDINNDQALNPIYLPIKITATDE